MALILLFPAGVLAAAQAVPEPYRQIQQRLQSGWNTWDSRSVLRHVLMPSGLAVNLSFKQQRWLDEAFLDRALIGQRGEGAPQVRPGLHDYQGTYTELWVEWQELKANIRSTREGDDLIVLVEPLKTAEDPVKMVVSMGMLWNRPGILSRERDQLKARLGEQEICLHISGAEEEDCYVPLQTPYLVVRLDGPLVVSSGRPRTIDEAESALNRSRTELEKRASGFGDLADSLLAIESALAWNTIYEPRHDRVVSTVGRLWNEEYGGYCLFGWDNFFLAYLCAVNNRDLAIANVIEHLKSAAPDGQIPNDDRGNGSKSFDRSQPPVGAIMVREICKRFPERWLMETAYPVLLEWNRWWIRRRVNDGLLSYGSHKTDNPFNEPQVNTRVTAGYESGMDDSPMYEGVPFNREKGILELQDVGLNSLYIADCRALEEMARLLGRDHDVRELSERSVAFERALNRLWSEKEGYYLNRRSDSGELSSRRSPTLFYPLLTASVPLPRVRELMDHFHNPKEFYGEWMLPSISRDDPDFPEQRYWKGAVWPPLNFLCYLALRTAGQDESARDLAEKSLRIFLSEWQRKGFVSENYSAFTGSGDDERLSSDRFHSWGALMAVMSFIENGFLPSPRENLVMVPLPGDR